MLSLLLLILGLNRPKKALLLTAKVHLSIVYTYKEKGPNHFFYGRTPARHKQSFCILTGALINQILEGIAPLRHWYVNPNEKSNKYNFFFTYPIYQRLIKHFLQENAPLRPS